MKFKLNYISIVLIFIGLINSLFLFYESSLKDKYFKESESQKIEQFACSSEGQVSCFNIQNTKYGHFLGIPVSLLGVLWFIVLLVLTIVFRKRFYYIYLSLLIFGFLFAGYLQLMSYFELKYICKFCFGNFMIIAFLLVFEIFLLVKNRFINIRN